QGTSATKAVVVGPDGSVLGTGDAPVRPHLLPDGGVEQDPEALWQSVVAAGRAALAQAREPVVAIGLANQGETVLAWDRDSGQALSQAISWQDRRAFGVCEALANEADRLHEITGLPLDPYFAAPKMRWLREHVTREGVCTTTDAWLLHRLTGRFATDAATASRTLLLDLGAGRWSAEACDAFDVEPGALPEIVGCAEPLGDTTVFGERVPVTAAIVDQQAALFAQGCHATGDAKCTYGTGAFLLANLGGEPRRSTSGLATSIAWRRAGETTFCIDGQVYTVGAAVAWLQDLGLVARPDDLDAVAGTVPDAGGVHFVPALAGLAAPFWKPQARGAFVGLSLATSKAHLVRAVAGGIAAEVAWLARAVAYDLGGPLARLRVDGGLTRSRMLLQTQADLLQVPVDVYPSPDATALGVAALARLGAGLASSPADAVGAWVPTATFLPRMSSDEAETRLRVWRRAVEATMDLQL
ncbi:MAG: FGGY family carbohydrate kinase, partial [Candidatus Binatia bacterium]